jgi:hypothetical protein
MNEKDLRDCFAMFAMLGWCMNGDFDEVEIPKKAWKLADAMIEARDEETVGLPAIKKRVRK